MGNSNSNSNSNDFQTQNSKFMQRAEIKHISQVTDLFIELTGSIDIPLNNIQQKQFCNGIIELIAPQYTDDKKEILSNGWCNNDILHYNDIKKQIQKYFVTEFQFSSSTLKSHYPCGVKNIVTAALQIETPLPDITRNIPPVAIACVLDRSGSMSGSKLKFAIRSVCKVIKHLTIKDTFHLVIYDNNVDVLINNGDLSDKDSLKNIVKRIKTGGSTNIGDALSKASLLLCDTTLSNTSLKRIFLFSDGDANNGAIQSAEGLTKLSESIHKDNNITISTFGLGQNFNEAIMNGIAKGGAGDYYFIESAKDIPITMSKAIHGLLDLYGTKAELLLRGKGDGIINKVYGKFSECDLSLPIILGDLYGNDRKKLLLDIEVSSKTPNNDKQIICEATLKYNKINNNTTSSEDIISTISCPISIILTDNEDLIRNSSQNNTVYIAQIMQKTAAIDREIVKLLDKQDYDNAIIRKQQSLDLLLDAQQYDDDLSLPVVITRVENILKSLKERKNHSAIRKLVDWEACNEEDDCEYGYMCRSDSDDDCYSDNINDDYLDLDNNSDDIFSDSDEDSF